MSDPHNPNITGYAAPSAEEIAARKKRNYAIAAGLFAFVIFVMLLMLSKYGYFSQ